MNNKMDFEAFDNVLNELMGLSQKLKKAQLVQGPSSSDGNITDGNTEAFPAGGIESNVGDTGMDYNGYPAGTESIAATPVQKGCSSAPMNKAKEEKKEEEEEEEEGKEDKKKGKKDKEDKKEATSFVKDKDMEDMEKKMNKSDQQGTGDEIILVDDIINEVTKSVDVALQNLAIRTAYFMKSLQDYSLQQVQSLTEQLAVASEGIVKSFGVLDGEEHVPESAPKSIMTPEDVSKSQDQRRYSKDEVLELMNKSLTSGKSVVRTEDITMFELHGKYRPEVFEALGISVE